MKDFLLRLLMYYIEKECIDKDQIMKKFWGILKYIEETGGPVNEYDNTIKKDIEQLVNEISSKHPKAKNLNVFCKDPSNVNVFMPENSRKYVYFSDETIKNTGKITVLTDDEFDKLDKIISQDNNEFKLEILENDETYIIDQSKKDDIFFKKINGIVESVLENGDMIISIDDNEDISLIINDNYKIVEKFQEIKIDMKLTSFEKNDVSKKFLLKFSEI